MEKMFFFNYHWNVCTFVHSVKLILCVDNSAQSIEIIGICWDLPININDTGLLLAEH